MQIGTFHVLPCGHYCLLDYEWGLSMQVNVRFSSIFNIQTLSFYLLEIVILTFNHFMSKIYKKYCIKQIKPNALSQLSHIHL